MASDAAVLKAVFGGMKEKYLTFDINGDGTITNQEFRQVLEEMVGEPCPEEDWREFIAKVDYDNSGTISFEEFLFALFLWFAADDEEAEEELDDDEKDEVDLAFTLLKTRYREAGQHMDNSITKQQLKDILNRFSPLSDEEFNKIYTSLEEVAPDGSVSFKQYLYGIYLFVTNVQS